MRAISSRRRMTRIAEPASRTSYPPPAGKSTLSPGTTPSTSGADRGDDAAPALRLRARRDDEPAARLGLLVGLLDDDEVVERLQRQPDGARVLEHAFHDTPVMPSPFVELEVGGRTVKVTNPDKVYFPARGETKLDLVQYFIGVGDGIVRALRERPCQLKRQPEGVGGEVIWQKRVPEKRPDWIETARVTFPSGRHADELCVTELAHVVWAANLATLEFGAWPSRRRDPEKPDELRIDIDPQPGTAFAEAKQVAAVVHEVARRDRVHRVAEDERQPRRPRLLPHRAELGVPRRPPVRARVRARDRAARPRPRDHRVVEGGARREGLRRLQPERARPDDPLRLLRPRAPGRDRLRAGRLGRAPRRRDGGLHDRDDAGALRRARRPARGHRRRGLRPARPARVGRARGGAGRGRGAVSAELPEDAGRAEARAAVAR